MIPEISTIAKNQRELWLLVELAKSANTRNLIGKKLSANEDDIELRFKTSIEKTSKASLKKDGAGTG
jgi:hypothetical protein|tara:strand:+ start:138 stop:338 length:201 start_codon:yes stop_codon:yes gene_type:complete